MTLDILRKTGGWCIELQQPLKGHDREVSAIEIRAPTADISIRWGRNEYPSMLALLSYLCDVPEKLLRQLSSADFDRVMFAFINVMPTPIKTGFESGNLPLATPDEDLPEAEQVPPPDQLDPRFPAVDGPVRRLQPQPPKPSSPENIADEMNMDLPPTIQAVR